jgi:hypothetical protein
MKEDEIIVVQETEYTGAGKHIQPQLSFAKKNNVELLFGNPLLETPGQNIIFPKDGSSIVYEEIDFKDIHKSYLNKYKGVSLTKDDVQFLSDELNVTVDDIKNMIGSE